MANSETESWLIQVHPNDNVVILGKSVEAGETYRLGGRVFQFETALGLGHKLALRDVRQGDKILKYGAPIGSVKADIPAGAHVHLHNLQSDYLPTYILNEGNKFHG